MKQKGITLITLVITIVLLLILAAVAIGAIRNDSIIGHAQNQVSQFNEVYEQDKNYFDAYKNNLKDQFGGSTDKEETQGTPQIGDKVAYNEGTGYTSSIDSSFVMKNMEWRILDIEDDGTIELISTQPTDSTLTLRGEEGYLYGPDNLDKLCDDLYGNGVGASSARSLKEEDLIDFSTLDLKIYQYQYSADAGYMQYRTSSNSGVTWESWKNITNSDYQTFKEPQGTVIDKDNYLDAEGKQRIVEIQGKMARLGMGDYLPINTYDGIPMSWLVASGLNDTNNAANPSNGLRIQWLSTSWRGATLGHAEWGVRVIQDSMIKVGDKEVRGNLAEGNLFWSNGLRYAGVYFVRPVVVLNSAVQLTKVGDTWQISI